MSLDADPPTRLRFIAAAILVVGLGCAGAIYVSAGSESAPSYEPDDTKQYERALQLYGGTANVLATDFREWLGSLWHGRRLAFTVAFITVLAALGCWLASRALAAELDERSGADGHGTTSR